MSRNQNARRSHSIEIDNISFERFDEFKYLGTTLTNRKYIEEEIKNILKSGNVCYHSVQNLLSSGLLPRNLNTVRARIICALFVPFWPLKNRGA
jgi:hypothetical protein